MVLKLRRSWVPVGQHLHHLHPQGFPHQGGHQEEDSTRHQLQGKCARHNRRIKKEDTIQLRSSLLFRGGINSNTCRFLKISRKQGWLGLRYFFKVPMTVNTVNFLLFLQLEKLLKRLCEGICPILSKDDFCDSTFSIYHDRGKKTVWKWPADKEILTLSKKNSVSKIF